MAAAVRFADSVPAAHCRMYTMRRNTYAGWSQRAYDSAAHGMHPAARTMMQTKKPVDFTSGTCECAMPRVEVWTVL